MAEKIVSTIVTAMTSFASGAANIIVDVFDSVFISGTGDTATITNFGTYALVFLGIGTVTGVIGAVVAKVG